MKFFTELLTDKTDAAARFSIARFKQLLGFFFSMLLALLFFWLAAKGDLKGDALWAGVVLIAIFFGFQEAGGIATKLSDARVKSALSSLLSGSSVAPAPATAKTMTATVPPAPPPAAAPPVTATDKSKEPA